MPNPFWIIGLISYGLLLGFYAGWWYGLHRVSRYMEQGRRTGWR